jgi:hypothetical protein
MSTEGEASDCGDGNDDDDAGRDDGDKDSSSLLGLIGGGVDRAHFSDLSFATGPYQLVIQLSAGSCVSAVTQLDD